MRRLRLAFVLLSFALLVPVGLIVLQSARAAALERAREHGAVATRTFDEMQRALDDFLAAEEARAPGEYKQYYLPAGEKVLTRSPLADLPYAPFVVGYFELGQDRSLKTPLVPDAGPKSQHRFERIDELRRLVREGWPKERDLSVARGPARRGASSKAASKDLSRPVQKPSSTVALKGALPQQAVDEPGLLDSLAQIGRLRSYESKKKRLPRKLETQAQNVFEPVQAPSAPSGPPPRDRVDVNVDPMVSRELGDDRLALYRTVWSAEGSVRQGVVLEVAALGAWLREQALAGTDLAGLFELRTGLERDVGAGLRGAYVFQHRFSEPFGALRAGLALPVLPGTRDRTVWLLAAIVVVTLFGGSFAAYRMVATRVAYAQRRSNFVSAVTHELKTPLTVIRMYSEMLEGDMVEGDEKRREYYRTIGAESDRLGRLINNVLELSKIERGERTLDLVSGDVQSVLDEALEMLRPHAEATGFSLEVKVAAGLPSIRYDRDALVQIVFNLIDNAMKYARGVGEARVVLEASAQGHGVALRVRDFGPGVAPSQLERIFEPFYRPENELTRTSKGTGIGLALVRNLAEGMGGSVRGCNAVDGGFEVTVALRAAG